MIDSHWRIRSEEGTYQECVWENESAGPITQVSVLTELSENMRYFWQVRYKDSTGMWSNWSDETSFTTISSTSEGQTGSGGGGGGCFIATAAFGTPMAKEVVVLKKFRDKYLLTNRIGKGFVRLYYKHSPKYARFIKKRPFLKAIVRIGLKPLVAFCKLLPLK